MQNIVKRALDFAEKSHEGQYRRYGNKPYITHPVAVSSLITHFTEDEEIVAAALLHDVMEDCAVSYEEIKEKFGERVANMVSSLTNDEKEKLAKGKVDYMIEKMKSFDEDVLLIKLCDIFHNLSTTENRKQAEQYIKIIDGIISNDVKLNNCHWFLIESIKKEFKEKNYAID